MGLSLLAYVLLLATGGWLFYSRSQERSRPQWLRPLHYTIGGSMVAMVLLLLAIGLVGTVGHYGSLGHSAHLPVGLAVVGLTLLSACSATQISASRSWARLVHVATNLLLLGGYVAVSWTGWSVVQKYLP